MLDLLTAAATPNAMGAAGVQNLIAFVAVVLSLLSFVYSAHLDRETRKREDSRDSDTRERELRVEKSTAYLQLELASIDVFRFRAAHWDAVAWAETGVRHGAKSQEQLEEEANQFYYQSLNLFEVCSRFRHAEIVEKEVFGSWVAWFYETLESPYFRTHWRAEYCDNYTNEIRGIFDMGCNELDWDSTDDDALRGQFYRGVGDILDCDIIRNWNVAAGGSRLAELRARAAGNTNG